MAKLSIVLAAFTAGIVAQPLASQAMPGTPSPGVRTAAIDMTAVGRPSTAATDKLKSMIIDVRGKTKAPPKKPRHPFVEENGPSFVQSVPPKKQ